MISKIKSTNPRKTLASQTQMASWSRWCALKTKRSNPENTLYFPGGRGMKLGFWGKASGQKPSLLSQPTRCHAPVVPSGVSLTLLGHNCLFTHLSLALHSEFRGLTVAPRAMHTVCGPQKLLNQHWLNWLQPFSISPRGAHQAHPGLSATCVQDWMFATFRHCVSVCV